MIIIKVDTKGGSSSIDKALRKLKKKFDSTKIMKKLREKKEYTKPSVEKRKRKKKAIYIREQYGDQN